MFDLHNLQLRWHPLRILINVVNTGLCNIHETYTIRLTTGSYSHPFSKVLILDLHGLQLCWYPLIILMLMDIKQNHILDHVWLKQDII